MPEYLPPAATFASVAELIAGATERTGLDEAAGNPARGLSGW